MLRTKNCTTIKGYESSTDKMMKTIPCTYLGIDMTVVKKVDAWIDNETKYKYSSHIWVKRRFTSGPTGQRLCRNILS